MATLLPNGKQYYTTNGGLPLVGGKLYTYEAGTLVPKLTYKDADATVSNTNPVILDARGEAVIFWAGVYKIELRDSVDDVIWTIDEVASTDSIVGPAINQLRQDLANTSDVALGDAMIGVKQPFTGSVATNQHLVNARTFHVFDYMSPAQINDVVTRTRVIDVTVAIQAAINAAASVGGGRVHLPNGSYKLTAAISITTDSITISGANNPGTVLWQDTPGSKIFISSGNYTRIEHLALDYNITPEAGATALHFEGGGFHSMEDIIVFKSWIAIDLTGITGMTMHNMHLRHYRLIGIHAHDDAFEIHISSTIMDAGSQDVEGVLGGLRLGPGTVEAFFMTDSDVINGKFSMTTDSDNVIRERPAACEFTNALFDTSNGGVFLDGVADIDFIGCWFSNCNEDNIRIGEVDSIRFIGGRSISSRLSGASMSSLAKYLSFIDFTVRDNSLGTPGIHPGMILFPGSDGVRIIGGQYGGPDFYTTIAQQDYGIVVQPGATNYLIDGADVRDNGSGGILDDANAGIIKDCIGFPTKNSGIATIAVGTSSIVVNHGVNGIPSAASVVLTYGSSPVASSVANIFPSAPTATTFQINTNTNVVGTPLQVGWQVRIKGA